MRLEVLCFGPHRHNKKRTMKRLMITLAFLIACQLTGIAYTQKTAHVNMKVLIDTLPSRKNALAEIQEVAKRSEAELEGMDKELQTAYNSYMATKPEQSEQINQYEESKLQKMQQDFQKRQQELTTMVQNMTVAMNERTYKIVQDASRTVAGKKGIQYVLDEASTIVASGPSITNEVIAELLRLEALTSNK